MMAQGRSTRELFLPSCCRSKNELPAWRFHPHLPLLLCPRSKDKDKGLEQTLWVPCPDSPGKGSCPMGVDHSHTYLFSREMPPGSGAQSRGGCVPSTPPPLQPVTPRPDTVDERPAPLLSEEPALGCHSRHSFRWDQPEGRL